MEFMKGHSLMGLSQIILFLMLMAIHFTFGMSFVVLEDTDYLQITYKNL